MKNELARTPWTLRVDGATMSVRPSTTFDLAALAVMHHRCTARTMLGRYQLGGRQPSILALDRQVRQPYTYVVTMAGGAIVATATLEDDHVHGPDAAQVGILVEDSWQRLGIGRELMAHVAGVASILGHRELIAYPGLMSEQTQKLITAVGTTRMVNDTGEMHLHTSVSPKAAGGLGALRAGVLAA